MFLIGNLDNVEGFIHDFSDQLVEPAFRILYQYKK